MLSVEIGSLAILALCAFMERSRLAQFAREVLLLGASALLAEDLCIRLFDFYGYAEGWHLRVDRVPLLVGAIWPFVILSARAAARALWGDSRWLPLQAGALICFDAALVEPVAVRAGLWSWSEQCLFGVPLVGIAGWGLFGGLCIWLLRQRYRWLVIVLSPILANAGLVLLWWGAFRWGPRHELPLVAAMLPAALGAGLLIFTAREPLALAVLVPRGAAALLFFALAAAYGDSALWIYAGIFAVAWAALSSPYTPRRRNTLSPKSATTSSLPPSAST